MKTFNKLTNYFSKTELTLWSASALLILISFFIFDRTNYLSLAASLTGVSSLIFCAKGNPFGQLLMVIFSIMYGIISYTFRYYGEMITYLGMTAPMAVFSLISWLLNPYDGNKSEVQVNRLKSGEIVFMLFLTAAVTVLFYRGLPYLPAKSILRPRLRLQRHYPYHFMDARSAYRYFISVSHHLLCNISCQRHLRLYKLVAYAEKTESKINGTPGRS